jgi:hypothetical protein
MTKPKINLNAETLLCLKQIKILSDLMIPCIEKDPQECINIANDIQIFAELVKRYNQNK